MAISSGSCLMPHLKAQLLSCPTPGVTYNVAHTEGSAMITGQTNQDGRMMYTCT